MKYIFYKLKCYKLKFIDDIHAFYNVIAKKKGAQDVDSVEIRAHKESGNFIN